MVLRVQRNYTLQMMYSQHLKHNLQVVDNRKQLVLKLGKDMLEMKGRTHGGYNLRRWDVFTETNIGNVPKPHP